MTARRLAGLSTLEGMVTAVFKGGIPRGTPPQLLQSGPPPHLGNNSENIVALAAKYGPGDVTITLTIPNPATPFEGQIMSLDPLKP